MRTHLVTIFCGLIAFNSFSQTSKKDSSKVGELIPLEIVSIRANSKAPFAKTNLKKEDIAKLNLGQDLPFVFNQTPSVVVDANAGNGVGYTGIRIRGTDATRINVTLNGIPFNDAESQGTFFVNMPDFISSASSVQIQRGVGTSSNGVGAFGATINIATNENNEKSYAEFNNSFGSFNTIKNTIKLGSGLLNKKFMVDARLSNITSDGYVDRASSNLKAYYISGAYLANKSSLRLTVFSGQEKTYQAWNGIDEATLKTTRTFNSAGTEKPGEPYSNETDNYTQTHHQLAYNVSLSNNIQFSTSLFYVKGAGYYENYRFDNAYSSFGLPNVVVGGTTILKSDFIRQLWLDNDFYGQLISLQYKKNKHQITIGGGWNTYVGNHFGKLIWAKDGGVNPDDKFYNTPALKKDANAYAKWEYAISTNWQLFTDVQFRNVNYTMNGFRNNPVLFIKREFNFLNPKLGITFSKNGWQAFASYTLANKEPNRDDFEAGLNTQPLHETLHDVELGIEKRTKNWLFAANIYYMLYHNQLVNTGKINDVGAYTRVNVPKSYRLGIELQAIGKITQWLAVNSNLALSKNKIKSFTEFIDDYDMGGQLLVQHHNKNIALSPSIVGSASFDFKINKQVEISAISKYVGKQYLDNTQNISRSLAAFYTQDVRLQYIPTIKGFSNVTLLIQANNVFNKLYEPTGYTFSYKAGGSINTENYFFPMAGVNFMIGLNVRL